MTALKSGELTLRLARGGVLRGFVDDSTQMGCTSESRLESGRGTRGRRTAYTAQADEDEPVDEEPIGDEDPFTDEDSDVDPFDDELLGDDEDEGLEDDGPDEDFENATAIQACGLSRLRLGTRVHQAKVQRTRDGLFFSQIQLLR